jgi:hypothetical protein
VRAGRVGGCADGRREKGVPRGPLALSTSALPQRSQDIRPSLRTSSIAQSGSLHLSTLPAQMSIIHHPSSNPHCHHVRTEGEHCFFRGVASLPQLWKIFRPENQRSVADLQPALCRAVEEGPIITAQQISVKTPVFPPASLASSHPMPPPFPPASVGVQLELSRRRRRRWWHGRRYY